ncbi:CRACD-like protein [Emydura macquarii macquarii]|uniref:CRACD-like protein n=1 Tax=Emydura macquarii macquarii TaxID=1129001 RepID=UPI00352A6E61
MSSTRIMDAKLREAEGCGEDNSGKKKSKFKSFKKFFGKRKRKETVSSLGSSTLKPCQSAGDVTAPESTHIGYDSEDELETHKGIMGSRALSHDSIFIPEPAQEPVRPVRVFSQENVSDRIRALQLKLQHSMKLGPPPPFGIHAKRMDDAGTSSEDDGLPRSPPEMALLHEILSSSTATRFSDSHKHLSSLSLAGTGSEEEEQVTSGPSPRPCSTEGQLFPRHASAKTISPQTSDSSISPAADFDTPPEFSTCLDNSAAKHKLLIKPRNQRSSKMRRLPSRTQLESLNDLSCTPEEEEHDGREMLIDLTYEIFTTSHQKLTDSTVVTNDIAFLQRPEDFPHGSRHRDESPSTLQFTSESAIVQEASLHENNPEGSQTMLELTHSESDYISPLEPKENIITLYPPPDRKTQREKESSGSLRVSTGNMWEVSLKTLNQENKEFLNESSVNNMLSEEAISPSTGSFSCLGGSEKNVQKDGKIPMENSCNKETKKESAALPGSSKQLPKGSSQLTDSPCVSSDIPQPALSSQMGSWSLEQTKPTQKLAVSDKENNQSLVHREAILGKKMEKAANELSTLRKFSVSSARERPRAGSLHLKENSECESLLNTKLPLPKTKFSLRNDKLKEDVLVDSDVQEEKNSIKKQASLADSESEVMGKAADKMVAGCVSQAIGAVPMQSGSVSVSQCQTGWEDKSPFQVKLRSTSLSLKYRDSSSPESKGIKRYSAEINLEKEGLESLLKCEKAQLNKTADVNINGSVSDNIKSKAKSSEQLSTKPPLPKKPVLQNVSIANSNMNMEKQEKVTQSPESRSEDKDLEKKSCPSKVPEKTVPCPVITANSPGGTDSQSKPAWITIAKQKQRSMQQEKELNEEEKLVAQDVKSDTEKQNKEKERMERSMKQQTDVIKSKPSHLAPKTSEEQRNKTKSEAKEPLPRANSLSHHVSVAQSSELIEKEEINHLNKVSHSVPDQPSWMELAKKKSQAWSDMPQIIK